MRLPRCSDARCRTPAAILFSAALFSLFFPFSFARPSHSGWGCVAREFQWCEHDYPRWGGHNTSEHTITFFVLGPPASLIRSELPRTGLRPFAFPRPDLLSAVGRVSVCACTITQQYEHHLFGDPGLSGWGYALFHRSAWNKNSANFAQTEF